MIEGKHDSFRAYAIVLPGTNTLWHWVVYQNENDAKTEALEWLEPEQFEIKPIMRRMKV